MSTTILPSAPSEVSSLQGRRKTEKQILAALGDHRRLNGDQEAVYFVLRGAGLPVSIGLRRLPRIAVSADAEPAIYIALKNLGLRDEPHSRPPTIIVEPRRELTSAMPLLMERSSSTSATAVPLAAAEGALDAAGPLPSELGSAFPPEVPLPDDLLLGADLHQNLAAPLMRNISTPASERNGTPLQAPGVADISATTRAKSSGEKQREWCIQMATPKQMVSSLGFQAALKFETSSVAKNETIKKPSGRLWLGASTKQDCGCETDGISNSLLFWQQSLTPMRDPHEQLQRCITLAQPRKRTAHAAQAAIMLRRSRSAGAQSPTAAGAVAAREFRARQALLQARTHEEQWR